MRKDKAKFETPESIKDIYESLSDTGKIMVFTYTNAIRDKEMLDMRMQQADKELVAQ